MAAKDICIKAKDESFAKYTEASVYLPSKTEKYLIFRATQSLHDLMSYPKYKMIAVHFGLMCINILRSY